MDGLFKQMIENDIDNVFLNMNEFADMHELDGTDMPVVVDTNRNNAHTKAAELMDFQQGIYQSILTVTYKGNKQDLPRKGYKISFDGFEYVVALASFEEGMHVLTIVRSEG